MPKVKPLVKTDPRERAVLEEIGSIRAVLRLSQGDLAKKAGITQTTMSGRLKNVGSMRLSELWAIQDVARKAGFYEEKA